MPKFLNTRGNPRLSIAWCERCARKFPIDDLSADGDKPAIRVCRDCRDDLDPYKLPPRAPDNYTLPEGGSYDTSVEIEEEEA